MSYWPQTQNKAILYSTGIPLAMSLGLTWGSPPLSCMADGYIFGQRQVTDSSLTHDYPWGIQAKEVITPHKSTVSEWQGSLCVTGLCLQEFACDRGPHTFPPPCLGISPRRRLSPMLLRSGRIPLARKWSRGRLPRWRNTAHTSVSLPTPRYVQASKYLLNNF